MNINIPEQIQELLNKLSFRGNPNLKPQGSETAYTQEMLDEIIKCKNDPIYFIKNYIKVIHPDRGLVLMELYEYQERMIRAYHENKRVIFLTSRQQGKCCSINTKVRLKQKLTNQIFECTLGEFYVWERFSKS